MSTAPRALAAALILTSLTAAADDGTAAARALAKEARVAFDAGDFTAALAKYEEAFRLKPIPALQFNLGQCHRQLGHTEKALYFFRRFLDSNPPEDQAAQVRPLVAELEAEQARKAQAMKEQDEHARQVELERARTAAAEAQATAAANAAEEARRRAELEKAIKMQPAAPPPPAYQRPWFWVVVGSAVAIAAGVGVGVYYTTAPGSTPTTWPDINAR